MRRNITIRFLSLAFLAAGLAAVVLAPTALAATCGETQTSIIACDPKDGNPIWSILLITINVLSALIGLAAVGGFVYGAILYTSAADNASQVTKAKTTIANVALGLILYAALFALIQFLIPGGVFNRTYTTPPPISRSDEDVRLGDGDRPTSKPGTGEANKNAKTATITHLHSSGRFDRSTATWRANLRGIASRNSPSIITLTEAGSNRANQVIWEGWGHTVGESIVAWKNSEWRRITSGAKVIGQGLRSSPNRTFYASYAVLEHRASKQKWIWIATHLPRRVDAGPGKLRSGGNVPKWKKSAQDVSGIASRFMSQHKIGSDNVVVTADWNVNMATAGWQRAIKSYFPNKKTSNPVGSPGTNSGGTRTIDTSVVGTGVSVGRWSVVGKIPSSDHRPFVARYTVKGGK